VHDLKGHSTSSKLPLFDRLYITSYYCSYKVCVLYHTVYVTAFDFEKSFNFNETIEITGHMCYSIHIEAHHS